MGMYSVVATKDLPKAIGDGMTVYSVKVLGKKGKSGQACVAPSISDAVKSVFEQSEEGKAFIVDCIEELRRKVISNLHLAGKTITDEAIGISALLMAAKMETASQRMTKEAISSWFDADLAALIGNAISAKMVGIAADKLAKLVEGYKAKFQTLAMRECNMPLAVKAQLVKAMELLPEDYDSEYNTICIKVAEALTKAEESIVELAAL